MMKERRRGASKGVILFSSIIILFGTINFLSIIVSFFQLRLELQFKDHVPVLFSHLPGTTINSTAFWFSTVLMLIIMFCWIVSGVGTLILKEWARQLLLVSIGIYFLNKGVEVFIIISIVQEYSEQLPVAALIAGIVFVLSLSISITYFFTHPSVIKQFNRKHRASY
jgi:hypothetical protein